MSEIRAPYGPESQQPPARIVADSSGCFDLADRRDPDDMIPDFDGDVVYVIESAVLPLVEALERLHVESSGFLGLLTLRNEGGATNRSVLAVKLNEAKVALATYHAAMETET